jgi:hypothetical protein
MRHHAWVSCNGAHSAEPPPLQRCVAGIGAAGVSALALEVHDLTSAGHWLCSLALGPPAEASREGDWEVPPGGPQHLPQPEPAPDSALALALDPDQGQRPRGEPQHLIPPPQPPLWPVRKEGQQSVAHLAPASQCYGRAAWFLVCLAQLINCSAISECIATEIA